MDKILAKDIKPGIYEIQTSDSMHLCMLVLEEDCIVRIHENGKDSFSLTSLQNALDCYVNSHWDLRKLEGAEAKFALGYINNKLEAFVEQIAIFAVDYCRK